MCWSINAQESAYCSARRNGRPNLAEIARCAECGPKSVGSGPILVASPKFGQPLSCAVKHRAKIGARFGPAQNLRGFGRRSSNIGRSLANVGQKCGRSRPASAQTRRNLARTRPMSGKLCPSVSRNRPHTQVPPTILWPIWPDPNIGRCRRSSARSLPNVARRRANLGRVRGEVWREFGHPGSTRHEAHSGSVADERNVAQRSSSHWPFHRTRFGRACLRRPTGEWRRIGRCAEYSRTGSTGRKPGHGRRARPDNAPAG